MNYRTLGVLMQLIGLLLFLFSYKTKGSFGPIIGIGLLICGAVFYRKSKKEEPAMLRNKPPKSIVEKVVSVTVIIICTFIIGLLLMIVIPNFAKGYQEARQQRLQREATQSVNR